MYAKIMQQRGNREGGNMRLISTLEELDRELDEAEKAAQVSDDALRSRLSDLYL